MHTISIHQICRKIYTGQWRGCNEALSSGAWERSYFKEIVENSEMFNRISLLIWDSSDQSYS